jgi:hypothetical protein
VFHYLGFFFDAKLSWTQHVDIMCNRAHMSLKALQLLGNLVRGLDQAKWKLAYNTVCLPVLTYGCQPWYTDKQKGLVNKLQVVQNEAVRIISGTFRTMPQEPLHQLLTILPMDLRLDTLVKSTALRLYCLPSLNQLFIQIGEGWHSPDPEDLPLPTLHNARTNTTLRALAARVPASGPCITPYPDLPAGALWWNRRVEVAPKRNNGNEDPQVTSEVIVNACREGMTINIHCEGMLSNRNRPNGKQLGAASAVLYHEGKEAGHKEQVSGETVTDSDMCIQSLGPGLEILAHFLNNQGTQKLDRVIIVLLSAAAIKRTLDASLHREQASVIRHLNQLGELLHAHPNLSIKLLWLPSTCNFVGCRRARQLTLEAIHTADLGLVNKPQTIAKQKSDA